MAKKILVSGGAGFIGSHVLECLVKEGYSVRVLDDLSTGKVDNIRGLIDGGSVELIQGDIRDASIVNSCLSDVEAVIHMAALVSVPLSVKNPDLTFDINLTGTLNLLRSSAQRHLRKFVFISSCAVCGDPQTLPVTEETKPNPISPYAESKLLGERYTLGFSQRGLLPSTILRFFNVYGERQGLNDYSGVITKFINFANKNIPITIYGDGSQTRDFVNVKDVAKAVFSAVESKVDGEVFNVGSGQATSINELATTILELAGVEKTIRYEGVRSGDIKHSYSDISKTKRLLGYQPEISLKDGLQSLIDSSFSSSSLS